MSRLSIGYDVGRFTGTCAATGVALLPDTPCIATLSEPSDSEARPAEKTAGSAADNATAGGSAKPVGFVRRDYSIAAWDAGHRPESLFSYWRSVVPHPDAPRKLLVDDQTLLDIFLRLDGDDRDGRREFRFVLALILLRRRMLRSVGRGRDIHRDGECDVWLLQPRGAVEGAPPIRVTDPNLSEADLGTIAEQLGEVVRGDGS